MVLMYSTLKVVKIPSKCLGITYIVILVLILGYIMGYGLIYSNGYQSACPAEYVAATKVKGTVLTSFSDAELNVPHPEFYRRIWDASDIVTPPHGGESGGFFVLTNIIITPNQTRDICPESIKIGPCKTDRDCTPGHPTKNGNGVMTGRCVPISKKPGASKTCEIHAWCPVEDYYNYPFNGERALLLGTKEFTVLVKNTVEFPCFGPKYKRRNIDEDADEGYLKTCHYNPNKDKYCPTFRVGDIVEGAGSDYSKVALTGGIFSINIRWDCSFDWGATIKHCLPKYSFSRLDDENTKIAPGWNFRSAVYHEENRRTLTQNYGIKILIDVDGEGRKFDSMRFLLTVGAGIGFFAVASCVCDFLLDIFCALKNYWQTPWLTDFSEDMKYDLEYVRNYEKNQTKLGCRSEALDPEEQAELNSPVTH